MATGRENASNWSRRRRLTGDVLALPAAAPCLTLNTVFCTPPEQFSQEQECPQQQQNDHAAEHDEDHLHRPHPGAQGRHQLHVPAAHQSQQPQACEQCKTGGEPGHGAQQTVQRPAPESWRTTKPCPRSRSAPAHSPSRRLARCLPRRRRPAWPGSISWGFSVAQCQCRSQLPGSRARWRRTSSRTPGRDKTMAWVQSVRG